MMFRRVLVANRGEVAVRIMRTCKALDIETLAVYSDADADAMHTLTADHALRIGPATASDSYLSIPRLIEAALHAGADAVHPGYGFLSENAEFADACADAGVTFIGPSADVIRRTGSKIACRALAEAAGVPVVPGERPSDQTLAGLRDAVNRVGYPALLKPSAGGGGKGMKVVADQAAVDDAVASARREAEASFGDGTLYVERHLAHPHHIEVQVVGDRHGHVVHLFERECSVQRRFQKVVEETPALWLPEEVRARIANDAVTVTQAAGYDNVGTIEFLVEDVSTETGKAGEADTRHYFLEMNTRLQVEHPVTEYCTGIDLVQTQLEVAAGRPLSWQQADIRTRGHAIECRVFAEDPADGYLPQAGPILLYREPTGPGIRVDSGIREGDEVTVHYDPLLAKLVSHGATREAARTRMVHALRRYAVLGVRTNLTLLERILTHPQFVEGGVDTTWLPTAFASNVRGDGAPTNTTALVAALATAGVNPASQTRSSHHTQTPSTDPWLTLEGWR